MVNINNIPPSRSSDDTSKTDSTKPQGLPPNDSFRKSMDQRRPRKDQEEQGSTVAGNREKNSSLFDLSRSNQPKPKTPPSSNQSSFYESNSPSTSEPDTHYPSDEQDYSSGRQSDNSAPRPQERASSRPNVSSQYKESPPPLFKV